MIFDIMSLGLSIIMLGLLMNEFLKTCKTLDSKGKQVVYALLSTIFILAQGNVVVKFMVGLMS